MRKFALLFASAMLLTLASCLDGENSIRFTERISVNAGVLPDTVTVNTPVELPLRATAPNACWHSISFVHEVKADTLLLYAALAVYENHGEACPDVEQVRDSTFTFTPKTAKPLVVWIYSSGTSGQAVKKDTIFVKAE